VRHGFPLRRNERLDEWVHEWFVDEWFFDEWFFDEWFAHGLAFSVSPRA
jgi:hypothetical protein